MEEIYNRFNEILKEENREEAVLYVLDKLQKKEIDPIELYTKILTPSLNLLTCDVAQKEICIWKEHVKTAIVRTIVECCYPYIIEKKRELDYPNRGTAVVLCPPEEYHDLGARMVADYFTVCGVEAIFVGSNTPFNDFYNAIELIKPDYVVISVSNYYNLVITKKIIEKIKNAMTVPAKIIVGGQAFYSNPEKYKLIGANYYAQSFEDIWKILDCEVEV